MEVLDTVDWSNTRDALAKFMHFFHCTHWYYHAIDFILCTYQQGLFSKNPVSSLLELSYVSSVTSADLPGLQYSSLTPVKVFNYL